MERIQKANFLHGALILVLANALVKIIGAGFKIPLTYLIHEDGMGIFSTAYTMYTWMFVIATAGFPVAISKMVSESAARGNMREAHKTFQVSFYLLSVIGIIGTAILFFGAEFFAKTLGNTRAYISIKAVAPALLFVSLMSAYRGFFQGMQNMIPTAISEVVEALGKLLIGYFLAKLWLGLGVEYSAAGAVLGVSTGAFFGAVILSIIYRLSRKSLLGQRALAGGQQVKTTKQILFQLTKISVPITIGASVFSLTNVIDLTMIMNRLKSIGLSDVQASTLYGSYSGYAIPLFNLPPTLVTALNASIVPAIAGAIAVNNYKLAKKTTESALKITMIFALPCAVGLSILSGPILELVYKNASAESSLKILGIAVVFVSLVLVTNAILQATGYVMIPVRNMFIGGIVKIITNYILVGMPQININGAPIGTNLCYMTIILLNLIAVKNATKAEYRVKDFILKPIISSAAMAISAMFTYQRFMENTSSNSISTVSAISVAAIIYFLMLLAVGGIKREDVEMLPKGRKIADIMQRFRLLK